MVITAILAGDIETDSLTQWDTGVKIRLSGCVLSAVYTVEYSIDGCYLHTEFDPVDIDFAVNSMCFCLPDVFLQRSGTLSVRVSCTIAGISSSVFLQNFAVLPAEKPEVYLYTPLQKCSFAALAARLSALERQSDAAFIAEAAAQVKNLLEQVETSTDECESIRDSLSDTLAAIQSILNDAEKLESNIARAVSASQDAEAAYSRIDLVRAEMQRIADSASDYAEAAEESSKSAKDYLFRVQQTESKCRTERIKCEAAQEAVINAKEEVDEAAVSARDAASAAKAAADTINVAGYFIKMTNCTYNTNGAYTSINFADYGLSFDAAPVVIPANPFSSYTGTVVAYDITKTGFQLYLKHGSATGTTDVSAFVGALKEDIGGGM